MRNYFPKRTSGAPLHILNYMMFPLVLYPPPSFEAVYCYICGRRGVAVARYRMICLVLVNSILHQYREHINYLHVESTCHAFSKVVSKTFTLKQVYSKSTSIVFHRTISPSPDLEPALAQRFRPWIAQCTHIVTGYPNIV